MSDSVLLHPRFGYPICGAKAKSTGKPCLNPAGFKTDHQGVGRCRIHGGASTGPKDKSKLNKNKNSVVTGQYETLWYEDLSDKEKEFYGREGIDIVKRIDNELKLCDIREGRIMKRIKDTNDEIEQMTNEYNLYIDGLSIKENDEGTEVKTTYKGLTDKLVRLESALSGVQDLMAKLVKLKHDLSRSGLIVEVQYDEQQHIKEANKLLDDLDNLLNEEDEDDEEVEE